MKHYNITLNNSVNINTDVANPLQIEGTIAIKSSGGVREMMLSIFNLSSSNRSKALDGEVNSIQVELNNGIVFDGDIINAQDQHINYTDISSTYFCKEYSGASNKTHRISQKDTTTNKVLVELCTKENKKLNDFSTPENIKKFIEYGDTKSIIDRISSDYGKKAIYQKNTITVLDKDKALPKPVKHIPAQDIANNGVAIGLGSTQGRIFITCKMQPDLQVGDSIKIDNTEFVSFAGTAYATSTKFASLTDNDGDYRILSLVHLFNYYNGRFETKIEALM